MDIIKRHADGKPVLVFCNTRKGAQQAAETLLQSYEDMKKSKSSLPWQTTG